MRSLSAPASAVRRFRWSKSSNKATGCIVYSAISTDLTSTGWTTRIESESRPRVKPYTEAAFFHFKATGSLQRHRAYHAAYESDAFTVVFEADYATGYQTITVEDVSESEQTMASERCFRQCLSSAGDGCRRTPAGTGSQGRRQPEVTPNAMVIYTLVEASTEDDALATGKTVFDRLVGAVPHAGAVFDYYVTFDEGDIGRRFGPMGRLPVAAPVDSDEGESYLNAAGRRRKTMSSESRPREGSHR